MRKKLLQIILIAILIVIIEIPFINSAKSEGPFEDCLKQCEENYTPGSIAILNCIKKCAEEAAEAIQPTEITPNDKTDLFIKNPLGATSDITTLVKNILNFLWKIAWAIAPILIVYAGFLYITSAGNEEKVKTAQKTLIWALVGFAVVLIASSVPTIIQEFLSGESTSTTPIIDQEPEPSSGPGLPPNLNPPSGPGLPPDLLPAI